MRVEIFAAGLLLWAACANAQSVYRCGNTYQQEPCKGGKSVDVSPPVTDPFGPGSQRVYLCRAPDRNLYWMPDHCHDRGWTVERTELVPSRLPWEQQREIARAKRAEGESLVQDASRPAPMTYQQIPPNNQKAAECESLEAVVKDLDRQGRAGSQYYDLDRVRAERLDARNRQHRLGCR